jgi:translation initiation factor 2 subunit 1
MFSEQLLMPWFLQVGRQEAVTVLRVDKDKGYIDLSKRRVSPEDLKRCDEHFNKSKTVHSIVRHVAETTGMNLLDIQEQITWPLYRKYGHAFEAFKEVSTSTSEPLSHIASPVPLSPASVV